MNRRDFCGIGMSALLGAAGCLRLNEESSTSTPPGETTNRSQEKAMETQTETQEFENELEMKAVDFPDSFALTTTIGEEFIGFDLSGEGVSLSRISSDGDLL